MKAAIKRDAAEAVHFYGRIWVACAICLFLMVPSAICLYYGVWPELKYVFKGLLGVAPIYWTVGIIEVFTYAPMLGTGGTYLGFVTGSVSSVKVPCALNAMEAAGVKANTEEGDVISTIAIAVSSIVTTIVISLGVLMLGFLQPVLESPVLKPCFSNITPALMGALAILYVSKNWRIAVAPLVFMVMLFMLVPGLSSSVGILVPVGALIAIGVSRIMYKKNLL